MVIQQLKKITRTVIDKTLLSLFGDDKLYRAPSRNYPGFLSTGIAPPVLYHDRPGRLKIGKDVVLNDAFIDLHDTVRIGDYTFFGHGVKILTGLHDVNKSNLSRQSAVASKPVEIGKGVWIASFAIILPGAVIGENAVIGAGSVVHGNVEKNSVVAGNPAKTIKTLNI
jgi:maltose O-acetyltransferase